MSEDDERATREQLVPQQAMLDYLDELLQDATAPTVTARSPVVEQQEQPAPARLQTEAIVVPEDPAPDISEQIADRFAAGAVQSGERLPEWFGDECEVLLFDANGLMLAVPLVELGGILRMPPRIYELANQPAWHLGFMEVGEDAVSVVDTLCWMAPDRIGADPLAPPRYLVRIPDSPWALTCQRLYDTVTLRREDVHWRSARTRRRWLRGTVRQHLCALLDTRELAQQLSRDVGRGG